MDLLAALEHALLECRFTRIGVLAECGSRLAPSLSVISRVLSSMSRCDVDIDLDGNEL